MNKTAHWEKKMRMVHIKEQNVVLYTQNVTNLLYINHQITHLWNKVPSVRPQIFYEIEIVSGTSKIDVMFDENLVQDVPVEELEIVSEMHHGHPKKKSKK